MNPAALAPHHAAILECARVDYFWQSIPFQRLHTALDVGGHIGLWSWLCQQIAPHIRLTAIEAHPDNYAQLVTNCPDVTAVHAWCGYQDSAAGLCCREHLTGSHYVLSAGEPPAPEGWVIPLPPRCTLEDFGQIDLLKLDCEGSEFDILLNCPAETLVRIQVIVGEYHLNRGDFSKVVERLTRHGYRLTITPHSEAPHLGHFLALREP
jgi:hypothetical protein